MSSTTNELKPRSSKPSLLPPASPSKQLMPLTASPRPGSRSPQSIPSSPTSIRSASSAIFERDIEPLPTTLPLPHHSPNPHRTPRSRTTETLEQSVPSVLAEAASVLAETKDGAVADISVLAPVPSSNAPSLLSFGSPGGSRSPPTIRSRSPSPSPRPGLGARKVSGSVPTATTSPPQPLSLTSSPIPSPLIPTSSLPAAAAAASDASSPGASPRLRPSAPPSAFSPPASALLPDPTSLPSASHSKRLSFVSYSDLLTSTPVASVPLTTLTSPPPNQTPPHIPVVAAASSTAPSVLGGTSVGSPSRPLSMYSIQSAKDKRASTLISGAGDDLAMRLADDIGGEWEREGFGKGMEERLEEVGVGKA